jgi:hypothetical protein
MMYGFTKERCQEICEQAEKEQDREKLIVLTQEIVRLLAEQEERLRQRRREGAA